MSSKINCNPPSSSHSISISTALPADLPTSARKLNPLFLQDRLSSRDATSLSISPITKGLSSIATGIINCIKSLWNRFLGKNVNHRPYRDPYNPYNPDPYNPDPYNPEPDPDFSPRTDGNRSSTSTAIKGESITQVLDSDPRTLHIISQFLRRNGRPEQIHLNNGEVFCIWANVRNETIHLQLQNSHRAGNHENLLEIHLDREGKIEYAFENGDPEQLDKGRISDEWKSRLGEAVDSLIWTKGFSFEYGTLQVHRLALKRHAHKILEQLCNTGAFVFPGRINFLDDNLRQEQGVDAGGLSRAFFSDLCKYLFMDASGRVLNLSGKIPCMLVKGQGACAALLEKQTRALINLGRLLSFCHESQERKLGRNLPDSYFPFLIRVMREFRGNPNGEPGEAFILEAAQMLANPSEFGWMLDLAQGAPPEKTKTYLIQNIKLQEEGLPNDLPEDLSEEQWNEQIRSYFETVAFEPLTGDQDPTEALRREMKQRLIDRFGPCVKAAQAVIRGIPAHLQAQCLLLGEEGQLELTAKVQGDPPTRQEVAQAVVIPLYGNPVVRQKAQWIRDFILERDTSQKWIESLLESITGSSSFTPSTRLEIGQEGRHNARLCVAHTCFNRLDVPPTHITPFGMKDTDSDKEKFRECLELFLRRNIDGADVDTFGII